MFLSHTSKEMSNTNWLYMCLISKEGDGDQQHQLQTGSGGSPERWPAEEEQGAAGQTRSFWVLNNITWMCWYGFRFLTSASTHVLKLRLGTHVLTNPSHEVCAHACVCVQWVNLKEKLFYGFMAQWLQTSRLVKSMCHTYWRPMEPFHRKTCCRLSDVEWSHLFHQQDRIMLFECCLVI